MLIWKIINFWDTSCKSVIVSVENVTGLSIDVTKRYFFYERRTFIFHISYHKLGKASYPQGEDDFYMLKSYGQSAMQPLDNS